MASTGRLAAHSRLSTGLIVTGTGLAHFAFPDYFEPINAVAFPERPREFTYINGGVETVLGFCAVESPSADAHQSAWRRLCFPPARKCGPVAGNIEICTGGLPQRSPLMANFSTY
jgi:hypothetical protein